MPVLSDLAATDGHLRPIQRIYSDPSSAHEKALMLKRRGFVRVAIDPFTNTWGKRLYAVTAWGDDRKIGRL